MVLYLDASALIRLIQRKPESEALALFLRAHRDDCKATSVLSRVELVRTMIQTDRLGVARAHRQLERCHQVAFVSDLVDETSVMSPGQQIRSLQLIHLTSAKAFGKNLRALITYDQHLAQTGMTWGLPVLTP